MFTLNNPNSEESVGSFLSEEGDCEYFVFGREVGESGTPHLQGYICLKEKKSLKWLKTNIHKNAHWEIMRGTPQQASDYCKKDGDFVEVGTLPETPAQAGGAGNKRRWVEAFTKAQEGKFDEIDPQIRIMYHRTLKSIHTEKLLEQPRLEGELENLWHSIIGGMDTEVKRLCSLKSGNLLAENILATISRFGPIGIPSPLRSKVPTYRNKDQDASLSQATTPLMNVSAPQSTPNSTQPSTDDSEKWTSDSSDVWWSFDELSDSE